jgi:hypothetical protein
MMSVEVWRGATRVIDNAWMAQRTKRESTPLIIVIVLFAWHCSVLECSGNISAKGSRAASGICDAMWEAQSGLYCAQCVSAFPWFRRCLTHNLPVWSWAPQSSCLSSDRVTPTLPYPTLPSETLVPPRLRSAGQAMYEEA